VKALQKQKGIFMKKVNSIALISAVVMAAAFIAINLMTRTPASYRGVDGPSQSGVSTNGVFKPGGYIKFIFKPDIDSVGGLYNGTVTTRPVPPEDTSVELWESGDEFCGSYWNYKIEGKSNEPIKIEHKINIPNEEFLLGKSVLFQLQYSFTYPYSFGSRNFVEKDENIEKSILIELDDISLSDEEIAWLEGSSNPKWVGTVKIMLFVGICIALVIAIPKKKKQ